MSEAATEPGSCSDLMPHNLSDMKIVAVAEKDPERRRIFAAENNLDESCCYDSADSLYKEGKIADLAIIATQDRDHYDNAVKALKLGYDLILEKHIAASMEECR